MATAPAPPRPPVLNLPNALTTARLVLAVVLFACIADGRWPAGLVVFAAAAVTDWLDGHLARRMGLAGPFGRNFDPLVDKVLICGAFIFLLPVDGAGLAPWMVTIVVARELVITGLRSFLENQAVTFGADWLGKLKMGLQCAALLAILFVLSLPEGSAAVWGAIQFVLIYAMIAATALSGLQYVWRAALLLRAP
jgi:CDP-diacylglycerol---glycerol-3-phosphate 3-phosphatidyltransferase